MNKNKTIMVGSVPYTMKDLKESLIAANDEAKRYLERALKAEEKSTILTRRNEELGRMIRTALMALGATFK